MGAPVQSMTRMQKACYAMAILDLLFYFGTILTSVVVENVVSERRPMKFEISDNGTVTVSLSDKDELTAVWDYLSSSNYSSSIVYNAVYCSLILIAVTYLIIEVWLCCVLLRGSSERSIVHCKKWFWWRVMILLLTVIVASSDFYQMQMTMTCLILLPLNVYRLILMVLVLQLIAQMKNDSSSSGNIKINGYA